MFDIGRELTGDNTESMEYMRAALAGEIFTAVVNMHSRIFQTHYEPLRSASGAVRGVRGIALDITEQIVLAERLARAGALPCNTTTQPLGSLPAPPDASLCTLTAREHEVLQRVAAGMPNRVIAADLVMSPATVKWHLRQVYQKLGMRNRTAAVTQAQALGLLPAPARRSR